MFATAAAISRASKNAIQTTLFTLGQRKCLWLVLDQLTFPSALAPTHVFFTLKTLHSFCLFTPTLFLSASSRLLVSTEIQQSASSSPTAVHSVMCLAIFASRCWSSTQSTLRRTSLQTLHSLRVLLAHDMKLKQRLSSGTNVLAISTPRRSSSSHRQHSVSMSSTVLDYPVKSALSLNELLCPHDTLPLVPCSLLHASILTCSSSLGGTTATAGCCISWTTFPECILSTP